MPDAAPPLRPPESAGQPEGGPLTPERVEQVLADFRAWLTDLPSGEAVADSAAVDLHTLVAEFVALRHEVNLQTRSSRATLEQNAEALRQLDEALTALQQPVEEAPPDDESVKPLLKALIDVYDALALAARQVERQKTGVIDAVRAATDAIEAPPAIANGSGGGFWGRLLGRAGAAQVALARWHERTVNRLQERERQAREAEERLARMIDGLLTGYAMSLARVERVLPQFGLEPMNCAGRRFDPEAMEVVEVVADAGRPSGEVIEEVRRGYLRDGVVFRYAQVRVAK